MKYSILTLVFAVGTAIPGAYAQTQSNSTAEHHEEHSSTQVNPDGTAVQSKATSNERTDASNNADGSTSTSRSKQSSRKTQVKREVAPPAPVVDSTSTTEHHSSTTTTTDTKVQ